MKGILVALALLLAAVSLSGATGEEQFSDKLELKQNYTLYLDSVDWKGQTIVLYLYRDDTGAIIDKALVAKGDSFVLSHDGDLIVTGKLDQIFIGTKSYLVLLKHIYQFDKETGENILYIERAMLEKPYTTPT